MLVLTAVAVAAALYVLHSILIPFVLAAFIAVLFKPIVTKLRSWGAPTWLGLIIVLILSGGAIYGVSAIVSLGIDSAIEKAPAYAEKVGRILGDVERSIGSYTGQILGSGTKTKLSQLVSADRAITVATSWLGTAVSIMVDGAMVLLFLIFMVLGGEYFPVKMEAAFRGTRAFPLVDVYHTINSKVLSYLRVKTMFNILNGLVMFAVLTIFGVDFAPVIALLAFLFNYLPNIGSFITTAIPFLVATIQYEDLGLSLLLVGILVVLQNIVGNVLEPRAMGQSLDLSPVAVLFSLVFWGWMWGIVGMILSVPILAILKAVMEHFPTTRPIAILIGNRVPSRDETDNGDAASVS